MEKLTNIKFSFNVNKNVQMHAIFYLEATLQLKLDFYLFFLKNLNSFLVFSNYSGTEHFSSTINLYIRPNGREIFYCFFYFN